MGIGSLANCLFGWLRCATPMEQPLVELMLSNAELGLCLEPLGSRDLCRGLLVCKRWATAIMGTQSCAQRLREAAEATTGENLAKHGHEDLGAGLTHWCFASVLCFMPLS